MKENAKKLDNDLTTQSRATSAALLFYIAIQHSTKIDIKRHKGAVFELMKRS